MKIDTSKEELRDTTINALSVYICSIADEIKENADTFDYFKSKEVAHGEMPAPFEENIAELYRACINMSNIISNHD